MILTLHKWDLQRTGQRQSSTSNPSTRLPRPLGSCSAACFVDRNSPIWVSRLSRWPRSGVPQAVRSGQSSISAHTRQSPRIGIAVRTSVQQVAVVCCLAEPGRCRGRARCRGNLGDLEPRSLDGPHRLPQAGGSSPVQPCGDIPARRPRGRLLPSEAPHRGRSISRNLRELFRSDSLVLSRLNAAKPVPERGLPGRSCFSVTGQSHQRRGAFLIWAARLRPPRRARARGHARTFVTCSRLGACRAPRMSGKLPPARADAASAR
jgi:hypothetical protein